MGRIVGKFRFAFITVLLFTLNGFAGGAIAGKVTIVKGQVFIVRSGEKIQVKKDITVLESDVIESQSGGTARITMIDSNLVDVYPKSKVEIAKYVYKPNQDQKDVELKVDFGKIKSTVNQKYDGAKNKFQVKTPSAVAGVRGTVFTAEYDLAKKVSKVVTIEGLVAVTKIIDRERQTPPVFVRPDQVVKVDAEQAKTEQPRDLKADEREERKKEDKDLGYQYDPKKEPTPGEAPSSKNESPNKEVQAREPVKEQPSSTEEQANRPVKDLPTVAEDRRAPPIKDIKEIQPVKEIIKEVQVREPVRETPPIKEISAREPVKSDKEERRQERRQERQAEQQEKRQTASEDQQAKKQKQSEDEQAKKQKQMEENQTRKQKQSEEEQAKKQKQMEDMLAAKRKHAEEAQAKREEEQKKRAEEHQARRAELARRLAEIAKRAETVIRLPSGTTDGSTTISPINTLIPKQ